MKKDVIKALSMLTQVGITLITPILLCILFASWLVRKLGIGSWVVILGAVIGAASGFLNLWKQFKAIVKDDK